MARRTNEQSLGSLISEFLEANNLNDKMMEARIMVIWEKVMGGQIARYTDRMTVQGSSLTVHLSSSVLRNELSMAKTKIIQMINEELKQETIRELNLR